VNLKFINVRTVGGAQPSYRITNSQGIAY